MQTYFDPYREPTNYEIATWNDILRNRFAYAIPPIRKEETRSRQSGELKRDRNRTSIR